MNKKATKIVFTSIFFTLIATAFFLSLFFKFPEKWHLNREYISFGCVCATALLSLLFVGKNVKKVSLTLALVCITVANFFFFNKFGWFGSEIKNALYIGLYVFCGAELFFLIYSLSLHKGIGLKVVNIAIRVALCLMAYFILPKYFSILDYQMIGLMIGINSAVTMIFSLFYIKTEWLTFLGLLVFLLSELVVGFKFGGFSMFNMSGKFVDLLNNVNYNFIYYFSIPGLFLISASSVWAKKKER